MLLLIACSYDIRSPEYSHISSPLLNGQVDTIIGQLTFQQQADIYNYIHNYNICISVQMTR